MPTLSNDNVVVSDKVQQGRCIILRLSAIANERLNRLKDSKTKLVSSEQMMKHLGIKKEDLDKIKINLDGEIEQ